MYNMIPYRRSMSTAIPSLFNESFLRDFFGDTPTPGMKVDVREDENGYLLEADLPGVDKEHINLEVHNGVLTISADMNTEKREEKKNYVYSERRSGHMERSFNLEGVDENGITADYANGVLSVCLPKQHVEETPEVRRIEIG